MMARRGGHLVVRFGLPVQLRIQGQPILVDSVGEEHDDERRRHDNDVEPLDGFDRLSDCHQSGLDIVQAARDFMNSGGRKLVGIRPDGRSGVYEFIEGERRAPLTTDYCAFRDRLTPIVSE